MSNRTCNAFAVAAAMVGLAFSTACTDPTVSPSSTVTEENIFKDPGSYQAFLGKIYAGMSTTGQQGPAGDKDIQTISDEGFSQYMRLYWEHQEMPTDEAALAWDDGPVQEFNSQTWGSSNSFVSAMFARIYLQVGWANEFLKQTTDSKLSERGVAPALRTKILGYRAQARFLRALAYWHGIDLFGPIPLVTANNPTPPAQNTRTEVYDFIVSELTDITNGTSPEQLANASGSTYGLATVEAANMLLAKVYMNAEVYTGTAHYDLALTAINAVIAGPFSLNPVYLNNFAADNNISPEIIFPIVQDGVHSQSFGGTTFLIHASCGGQLDVEIDTVTHINALGVAGCWYGLRLKQEAFIRQSSDPRGSFLFTSGQNDTVFNLKSFSDGIMAPKFSNFSSTGVAGASSAFPDTDFPMFRLADAYLMYAEAVLRGGGGSTGQALIYVNQLRQRAYGDNSGDITAGQLDLQFILDERGRELLWEGHRRTDLVRYGQFTGPTLWAWKGNVAGGQSTPQYLDLYPIPANQLSANPNLTQNPGY